MRKFVITSLERRTRSYMTVVSLTFMTLLCSACQPYNEEGSAFFVINGGPVTSPDQAPGTYKIEFVDSQGNVVNSASLSAIGEDRFLTNAHVTDVVRAGVNRDMDVRITDYRGAKVYAGSVRDVKTITHPGYKDTPQSLDDARASMQNDIGGLILPYSVADRLSQGFLSVARDPLQDRERARLAGAGGDTHSNYEDQEKFEAADREILDRYKEAFESQDAGSPTPYEVDYSGIKYPQHFPLTFGENEIRRDPDGNGYFTFGTKSDVSITMSVESKPDRVIPKWEEHPIIGPPRDRTEALTVPGDSGGSLTVERNGRRELVGINQGGGPSNSPLVPGSLQQPGDYYDPAKGENPPSPDQWIGREQSYFVDVTQHQGFIEQVQSPRSSDFDSVRFANESEQWQGDSTSNPYDAGYDPAFVE